MCSQRRLGNVAFSPGHCCVEVHEMEELFMLFMPYGQGLAEVVLSVSAVVW